MYVVWVPALPADDEGKVPAATARIPDERASHYWDEKGALKAAYQRALRMEEPAWDVYYVYGRDAVWEAELPPAPDYYMHQLRSLPPERVLDGDTLAEEINKLLGQK